MERLSLSRNAVWMLVSNVVYVASQGGIFVLFAKLGSPEILGQFALGLAISGPVFMFANLALRPILATDVSLAFRLSEYLQLRVGGMLIGLLLVTGLVVGIGYPLITAIVVVIVASGKAIEGFSDLSYGLFQRLERLDRMAVSRIVRGILSVAAVSVGLAISGNVVVATAGLFVSWLLVVVFYDFREFTALSRSEDPGAVFGSLVGPWVWVRLRALTGLSLPLAVSMMLISLSSNIPRYFVDTWLGEAALGYFAAAAYLVFAGTSVVSAIGQSALPLLRRHYVTHPGRYVKLVLKLVALVSLLGLVGVAIAWVAGDVLLSIVYTPDYGRHADVLLYLSVAGGFSMIGAVLNHSMTAARRLRTQVALYALVALVVAGASIVFVPSAGVLGAAWASVVGYVLEVLGGALIVVVALRADSRADVASTSPAAAPLIRE